MRRHRIHLKKPFLTEAGGRIEGLELVFHTSPRPYSGNEPVVWVCHALTANSDVEDWWPGLCGPGKFIDTQKYYVVCVNIPGSPYGTSGPACENPATGKPWLLDFPDLTIRDVVKSLIEVRKYLGIKKVDLLVGSSIGGFQAVEWAIMEPEVIRRAAFIATAARVPAYLTAFNESQRMALEADPTFREAASLSGGKAGLECARSIALLSYRSWDGYAMTQTDASPDTLFASRACSYQRYQGRKLSARFDAYSYWTLTRELDSHNVGRGRGGVEAALGTIRARCRVVGITTDLLFPPSDMKNIARNIPGADYREITSDFGHDGFLLESGQLTDLLTPLMPCK